MSFKKYIQITSVLGVFFALVFIKNALGGGSEGVAPITPNPTTVAALPTSLEVLPTDTPTVPTPSNLPAATLNPTPVTTPRASQYKDGAFTGSVADAFYGNVQIQVVVSGGKISQVNFLQYPNDQRTSQFINSQAMPLLQQEAISAQSAKVSGVSGASATSGAFVQSLGAALTQARA
jgi:uncharacterized protein with FMN-binding domain